MAEPTIVVHHREQLAELLTEAAEVEHNLMCCYLFAAWSLESADAARLTPEQARDVAAWRRTIVHVAIDEMTHLANANNILSAIGARPHFGRPNFPVSPGYHPAGVVVELRRFDRATIDHFVYLERPEGVELDDGEGFARPRPYARATRADVLMPSAQDYATVGHLYRAIQAGLRGLAERDGEDALFVGDPSAQIGPATVQLDGLVAVTDLASALQAVENTVTQGEGNFNDPEGSHYRRFCAVRDALARHLAADPTFDPARAVVASPVQRKPPVPDGKTWIGAPQAARVLDLCNALYNHMLRLLGAAYDRVPAPTRAGLVDEAIGLMKVLVPLNDVLTRLPADEATPEAKAGMSFAVTREIRIPPAGASVPVVAQRTAELAVGAAAMADIDPAFATAGRELASMGERLGRLPRHVEGVPAPGGDATTSARAEAGAAAAPVTDRSSDPTIPPRTMVGRVETVEGTHLTLHFDHDRCIHARFCVTGAPDVFIGNVEGPWLRPDAVDVEELVAIAQRCPSGAITYARKDVRPEEAPAKVNLLRVLENGPYAVRADLRIEGQAPRLRATLCRCGKSKRKPFCDGSHHEAGFAATGEPEKGEMTQLVARDGELTVRPLRDGPLLVHGNLEIIGGGTGATVAKVTRAALCRCGGSKTKPFCDGTHKTNGFCSD